MNMKLKRIVTAFALAGVIAGGYRLVASEMDGPPWVESASAAAPAAAKR